MNTKVIVKAMNFHSLLRVDMARKKADQYRNMEKNITDMIDMIVNNRNFLLDKETITPDAKKPILTIYIGSDYGFCGGINAQVNKQIAKDENCKKVLIGRKLRGENQVVLSFNQEQLLKEKGQLKELFTDIVYKLSYSEVNVVYNHYYNISNIQFEKKKIFPLEKSKKREKKNMNYGMVGVYEADYYVEGNVNQLLRELVVSYLQYELKIAAVNAYASENIMRRSATDESLKKIEENEERKRNNERRAKVAKAFSKVIESYVKLGREHEA